jgi:hypothetical protein
MRYFVFILFISGCNITEFRSDSFVFFLNLYDNQIEKDELEKYGFKKENISFSLPYFIKHHTKQKNDIVDNFTKPSDFLKKRTGDCEDYSVFILSVLNVYLGNDDLRLNLIFYDGDSVVNHVSPSYKDIVLENNGEAFLIKNNSYFVDGKECKIAKSFCVSKDMTFVECGGN